MNKRRRFKAKSRRASRAASRRFTKPLAVGYNQILHKLQAILAGLTDE